MVNSFTNRDFDLLTPDSTRSVHLGRSFNLYSYSFRFLCFFFSNYYSSIFQFLQIIELMRLQFFSELILTKFGGRVVY